MALREVQSLENEEWAQLVTELKKDPAKEKVDYIKKGSRERTEAKSSQLILIMCV